MRVSSRKKGRRNTQPHKHKLKVKLWRENLACLCVAGNGPGERRQPRETGGLEGNIVGHYPGAGERRWGLMHRRKLGLCQEQGHRSREKAECMGRDMRAAAWSWWCSGLRKVFCLCFYFLIDIGNKGISRDCWWAGRHWGLRGGETSEVTQKSEKNEWIREVENGGFEALGSTSVQ